MDIAEQVASVKSKMLVCHVKKHAFMKNAIPYYF